MGPQLRTAIKSDVNLSALCDGDMQSPHQPRESHFTAIRNNKTDEETEVSNSRHS